MGIGSVGRISWKSKKEKVRNCLYVEVSLGKALNPNILQWGTLHGIGQPMGSERVSVWARELSQFTIY